MKFCLAELRVLSLFAYIGWSTFGPTILNEVSGLAGTSLSAYSRGLALRVASTVGELGGVGYRRMVCVVY